jgi:hypothetical protein
VLLGTFWELEGNILGRRGKKNKKFVPPHPDKEKKNSS